MSRSREKEKVLGPKTNDKSSNNIIPVYNKRKNIWHFKVLPRQIRETLKSHLPGVPSATTTTSIYGCTKWVASVEKMGPNAGKERQNGKRRQHSVYAVWVVLSVWRQTKSCCLMSRQSEWNQALEVTNRGEQRSDWLTDWLSVSWQGDGVYGEWMEWKGANGAEAVGCERTLRWRRRQLHNS